MREVFTVQEVADYLKVSRSTVWRWCNEGKLVAFKAGRGWRVRQWDLEKMLEQELEKANVEGSRVIAGANGL
ncbi:MAG: helix-turn-helix domain-containing protein [Anaerolineales bacterium]|nr:helix-turn-helix domain-containing protein [Anaerolineales bacterium]